MQNQTKPLNDPIVFIIDDDPVITQAIAWLLETVALKTQCFSNAESFLEKYNPNVYGCLIIDVRMPGMSGLELQKQLNERHNRLPIIMMSGHGDVPMAVRAMQAGAKDFILKPFNDQVLLEKIQAAIVSDKKRQSEEKSFLIEQWSSLTTRERQVIDCLLAGKLNKQIATELNIAMSTVELYRAKIMEKMQAKTVAELVKLILKAQEQIGEK